MKVSPIAQICLVEDNEADVRLIREMLQEAGDGRIVLAGVDPALELAIDRLRTQGETDLILLDLSLSDSKGIETFRRLHRKAPQLPIIALSGHNDEALATQVVHEGAQDYLIKNELTPQLLVRAIHYAIERNRAALELRSARDELEKRVEDRARELQETNSQLAAALNQLSEAQAQMIQQERLHALERMASGIAHDFNNALSPILAHSEWLLMKPHALEDEENLKKTLLKIHDAAMHCAEVVSRLREFYRSRDELAQFAAVDLRSVLKEVVSLTQPCWKDQALSRGHTIRVETNFAKTPKIFGSKTELRDMLTNILLNSVDAIPQNGVIRVNLFSEKEQVCIRISDNGVGMSEEVGERCMEPFFTTKHGMGSGLGLGVVYGIAQRHDAQIEIESEIGVGTDVTVRFPAYNPEKTPEPVLDPVYGLKILVAEDEPAIREVLGIYLGEDAHRVEMAADGREALAKIEPGRFDLLITDRSMPELSGDLLAEAARMRDPKLRILLLTGFGDLMKTSSDPRPEVDAISPKPFTFDSLRRAISQAMAARTV